jgi:hypothetical protein
MAKKLKKYQGKQGSSQITNTSSNNLVPKISTDTTSKPQNIPVYKGERNPKPTPMPLYTGKGEKPTPIGTHKGKKLATSPVIKQKKGGAIKKKNNGC